MLRSVLGPAFLLLVVGTLLSACDTGFKFSTSPSIQKGPGSQISSANSGSTSTTSDAPLCLSRDLVAKGGSRKNPNDVGGAVGDVIISNSAPTTCQLRGAPNLHLLRKAGSPMAVQGARSVSPVVAPVVLQPKGRSAAELVFTWQNWCGTNPGALAMQIDLAYGGGMLVAPLDSAVGNYVPTCVMPDKPSVLRVQYAYVSAGQGKVTA
jgi:hypothetical protein